jgi:hypothetical protein
MIRWQLYFNFCHSLAFVPQLFPGFLVVRLLVRSHLLIVIIPVTTANILRWLFGIAGYAPCFS